MTRAAPTPRVGVAKNRLIVDEKIGQTCIGIKLILTRTAVVTNLLIAAAGRKARRVAGTVGAVVVEALVHFGEESVKVALLQVARLKIEYRRTSGW